MIKSSNYVTMKDEWRDKKSLSGINVATEPQCHTGKSHLENARINSNDGCRRINIHYVIN